jgi:hypothetical protein
VSVTLEALKGRPFQVGTILPEIEKTLKLILGLPYRPKVIVSFVQGAEDLQESIWIKPGVVQSSFSVTLGIEQAGVRIYSSEGADYFVVKPDAKLALALGAAVAIAIAEYSDSEISDTGSFYTLQEYSKPDEFVQLIKVDKTFNDIDEAIKYFITRLPGAGSSTNNRGIRPIV